ncbi:hypothetical protein L9F63_020836, partial [Diploptera punctata]
VLAERIVCNPMGTDMFLPRLRRASSVAIEIKSPSRKETRWTTQNAAIVLPDKRMKTDSRRLPGVCEPTAA